MTSTLRTVFARGHVGDVLDAHGAAALDQRHDGVLLRDALALLRVLRLAANVGLIRLDGLAFAADRPGVLGQAHGLADAVIEEPRGLVRHAHHAVHLMSGDALLA